MYIVHCALSIPYKLSRTLLVSVNRNAWEIYVEVEMPKFNTLLHVKNLAFTLQHEFPIHFDLHQPTKCEIVCKGWEHVNYYYLYFTVYHLLNLSQMVKCVYCI